MSLYGLIVGLAITIGYEYFTRHNQTIPKKEETLFSLGTILSGIIGARSLHVLENLAYYTSNPLQIINLPGGGLAIYGGIIGATIFICIYCLIRSVPITPLANNIARILPLCQSIGRWGNFVNQEVFGIPTKLSFGQFVPYKNRPLQYQGFQYFHPVWLYESLLCLLLYLIMARFPKYPISKYLIGYGLIRFFLEYLRFDSINLGIFTLPQILSLFAIFAGSCLIILEKSKQGDW